MISDIEYLNFIDEGEFKKYRLKTRILNDDGSHIHQAEHNNRRSLTSTSDKFFLGLIENMKIEKQIDNLRVRLC